MEREEEVKTAIIKHLEAVGGDMKPVSMYVVGTALVTCFSERELADAAIALKDRRAVEILNGNSLELR